MSYNIILDTGSSDLWLQDAQPTGQDAQSVQTLYSPTGSSTFNSTGSQPFTIQYLGGDVSGNTARETVSMAGFTVSGQQFGEYKSCRCAEAASPVVDMYICSLLTFSLPQA